MLQERVAGCQVLCATGHYTQYSRSVSSTRILHSVARCPRTVTSHQCDTSQRDSSVTYVTP